MTLAASRCSKSSTKSNACPAKWVPVLRRRTCASKEVEQDAGSIERDPVRVGAADQALCQACGACCAYSAEWPRFSLESEAELARIPPAYVDDANGRMRCTGDRCTALAGEVGVAVSCLVYGVRPLVCRECQPGDPECATARRRHGLPPLSFA
jgi:Fe-S-cluster containining protein